MSNRKVGKKKGSPEEELTPKLLPEQVHADHELFLQAFEKPTQIYRYLRTRNLLSPVFLYRTLTFMKDRSPRSNSGRKTFKVDSLLDRLQLKLQNANNPDAFSKGGFMTLTFLGYYESKKNSKFLDASVPVELLLLKSTHKKRKESLFPMVQETVGTVEVPCNPSEDHPPSKAPALSISSDSLSPTGSHQVKFHSILLKVHRQYANPVNSHGDENTEPSTKRRKSTIQNENSDESIAPNADVNSGTGHHPSLTALCSELKVYDKNIRCHLTDGEYEVTLSETDLATLKFSPKKNSAWETLPSGETNHFGVFESSPTVKFRLSWTREPAGPLVERPRPLMPRGLNHQQPSQQSQQSSNNHQNHQEVRKEKRSKHSIAQNPPRIIYQFLYNNNTRQQTEAREDLHCPWCSINCKQLYPLLKHLKLSHPRFLFTYVPMSDGARIDVSVSELYDSTYVGNPHDLINQPPGSAFSRFGPVQRTSITNILVCKPKRTQPSLSEFLEIEENDLNGPYDGQRPYVSGHNRLYHYSTTCLPMPPHAILQESTEDLVDPNWLLTKMCQMIDEFSDVNEGEKEFMKMWNIHVQHYTFVGDCQIPFAIKLFIEEKGKEMIEKGLYKNFMCHICNLFEFGVLAPGGVFAAISQLQQFMAESNVNPYHNWKEQSLAWKDKTGQIRKDFSGIFNSENAAKKK